MSRPLLIGLTGGIGSGKSRVAGFLHAEAGAEYINADAVCRGLLAKEGAGWRVLARRFGQRFFLADGQLDRPGLRRALFADPRLRTTVDGLLHPLVRQEIRSRLAGLGSGGMVVVEVPLLYEAGWETDFQRVVVVYADPDQCLQRLLRRDRVSPAEGRQAITAQLPLGDKACRADHVVDNSGHWALTVLQLLHLVRLLRDGGGGGPAKKMVPGMKKLDSPAATQ